MPPFRFRHPRLKPGQRLRRAAWLTALLFLSGSALYAQEQAGSCATGNCQNGTGTYQFASGDTYSGGFREGLRHGPGVYRFAKGDVLKAVFSEGRPLGAGEYRFADGRVFSGEFVLTAKSWRAQGVLREKGRTRFCTWQEQGRQLRCSADRSNISPEKSAQKTEAASQSKGPPLLLVLYTSENCRIRRGDQVLPGGAGIPLYAGDRIETGPSSAELQAHGGMAIQLAPFSVLEIPPQRPNRAGVLLLRKGRVSVDYEGDPRKIPFRIRAAGTDFDVKGTSFVIEINPDDEIASVKVYEGEVQMSPALPALDRIDLINPKSGARYDPQEMLSQESYDAIADALLRQSVAVKANQEASLNAQVLNAAAGLNAELNLQLNAAVPDTQDAVVERVQVSPEPVAQFQQTEPAEAREYRPSPQELAAMQLLVVVDELRFREALQKADADPTVSAGDRQSISQAYENQLNRQADQLEADIARERPVKDLDELLKIYSLIEVLHMRDGTRKAGTVMAQAGNILIIHAPDGVFRVETNSVQAITFHKVIPDEIRQQSGESAQ